MDAPPIWVVCSSCSPKICLSQIGYKTPPRESFRFSQLTRRKAAIHKRHADENRRSPNHEWHLVPKIGFSHLASFLNGHFPQKPKRHGWECRQRCLRSEARWAMGLRFAVDPSGGSPLACQQEGPGTSQNKLRNSKTLAAGSVCRSVTVWPDLVSHVESEVLSPRKKDMPSSER